jgi:hypothetical protein
LVLDNASSRADLQAMQWLRANHIHVVTLPPHLTHIMQLVDVCWAWAFETEYGRCLRKWLAPEALARAYAMLPPAASRGRSAARDSRVVIALASADAARIATSSFNAAHAFSVAGLVPCNVEKPLARRYVGPCDADVEREMEAKNPARLHTGSRMLTMLEFLARLAIIEAEKGIREDEDFAREWREFLVGLSRGRWHLWPDLRFPTKPLRWICWHQWIGRS